MQACLKLFTVLFCLLLPVSGFAYYVIELKTGSTITTQQYWKEDGQIKFYHHGGIVGIPADTVKNIRDADSTELERHTQKSETTESSSETQIKTAETLTSNNQDEFDQQTALYQGELQRINTEMSVNAEYYNLAKDQDNETSMNEAMRHLIRLREERRELRKKVVELYDGEIPEWWTHE